MTDLLKQKIAALPASPGVYKYFNESGELIYVGKAKHLKKRVSSYFTKQNHNGKTKALINQINDLEFLVVNTEHDAFLLENNLIKKHQPKYNINLKDDKTFPWLRVKNENFPRVFPTRTIVKDGSTYFGPFASVKVMKTLLDLAKQVYPLRSCNFDLSTKNIEKKKFKVCLEFQIGNCLGPCEGRQTTEDYQESIEGIKHIIKGNVGLVLKGLKEDIKKYAETLEFERAQRIKEKIELLERYQGKSTIVNPSIDNVDVATIVSDKKNGYVNFMTIKNGAIVQGMTLEMKKKLDECDEELLSTGIFELRERYQSDAKEIIVANIPSSEMEGASYFIPQRGDKRKLLELSERNAKYYMLNKRKQSVNLGLEKRTQRILEQLQDDLRLTELPSHIECFDNSNFQGTNPVAACVVFKDAKPSKRDYRHFNIKTVIGPDDFASMEEVVYRRYKRLLDEEQPLPQLILIDGGKGQLSSAVKSLEKLSLRGKIAIVGIAKRLEEIYFPEDSVPLYLDRKGESLKLLQHLRNEAHRFGITHHRGKRKKSTLTSELHQIDGIGEKTAATLIRHFGSVKRVKEASLGELAGAVGESKAGIIFGYFNE